MPKRKNALHKDTITHCATAMLVICNENASSDYRYGPMAGPHHSTMLLSIETSMKMQMHSTDHIQMAVSVK